MGGGFDNVSPAAQISIGVLVGVISTSVQSLGLTLQRKSHLLEDDQPAHVHRRPPHRRRMWQIGMTLFIISNILGSTVQITTLPLIILSPLQASGLVFNSICATLILAEPFTRLSLVGTTLVCIGATLIAAFGAMKEPAHSLDELLSLLSEWPFLVWISAQAVLIAGMLIATRLLSIMRPKVRHGQRMRMIRGVIYGCVSGILSAGSLLLAKSAVELLVRTIVDRVNQFKRWQSWVILLGLVTVALTQLYYLHRGLRLCSTSVLYPLVFCVYNIFAILDGLIYYKQASRLSPLGGCLIALGTAILLTGVLALSWRLTEESPPGGPQQTTQSALTPSLGLLEHHPENTADESPASETDDLLAIGHEVSDSEPTNNESTNLLRRYGALESSHKPGVARPWAQRRSITEVEEIWGEFEDNGCAGERLVRNRSLRWPRHHSMHSRREPRDAGEESSPLIGNMRIKKALWRWSDLSYMFPSRPAQQPPSSTPGSSGSGSPPAGPVTFLREESTGAWRVPQLQEATGGWWKMRWWGKKSAAAASGSVADSGGASDSGEIVGATTSPPSLMNLP